MPVKVPIPIINQRVINNVLPRKTILSHQPCHPMQQPAKIPKSKRDQKATPDGAADHIRPPIHAFPFESMGRSGYDTTNMKVAKDPRPANKPKSTGDHEKNKIPEQQQEQQRKDQVVVPIYKIPQPCEQQQQQKGMPIPTLEGRGWTFWL